MSLPVFYTTDIQPPYITLYSEECMHCAKVLRMRVGEEIAAVDGNGNYYVGKLISIGNKECVAEIVSYSENYNSLPYRLHVACAPTKNIDRFEWFLEKATEIGISEITPLICEHSERRQIKSERLEKVIISAMKQSQKACLPKLNEAIGIKEFIEKHDAAQKFIGYCGEGISKQSFYKLFQPSVDAIILIGPEGDFSEEEIKCCLSENYIPVALGNQRLRTETAAVAACCIAAVKNEF